MITFRKITLENRRTMFNLEVSEDQRRFVASSLSSVASCFGKMKRPEIATMGYKNLYLLREHSGTKSID